MEKYGIILSVEKSKDVMFEEQYERLTTRKQNGTFGEFAGTVVLKDMGDRMRGKMWGEVIPWLAENKLEHEMNTECVMLLFKKKN